MSIGATGPLVSPAWLRQRLASREPGLVLLDARHALPDPGWGALAHAQARIPGARHAHLDRDLSGPASPGAGRHPWPAATAFAARLRGWGIGPGTRVVAYDEGDGAFAARAWWLLRCFGHRGVAVLDGGWAGWIVASGDVDFAPPSAEVASETPAAAAPDPAWAGAAWDASRLVDAVGVARHLAAGGLLLDARASARFRGEVEPIDRVAGHVPGATSRPYADNLDDGRFKPGPVLAAEFGALLAGRPPTDVVAMCGSGVTACHHLLAMAHAGLDGARLYTGSWSGWIDDPSRLVATGG